MSAEAAMGAQHTLRFYSDAEDPDVESLVLLRVEGREALSEPYEYTLTFASPLDGGLSTESIEAWLTRPCRFTFGEAQVSGVVREVRLLATVDPLGVRYEAVLVPRLATLGETVCSRVFQLMSVVDIVTAVLKKHAVPLQNSTREVYPVREYVVQYDESDLSFVSRLMEHWGIHYSFEQQPDGEVMVIGDANASFLPKEGLAQLRFEPTNDGAVFGSVTAMSRTHRPRAASVILRDYNWRTPYLDQQGHMTARMLQLRVPAPVDEVTGRGERWRYGEHVKDEAEAAAIAAIRAQQMMSERVTYAGGMHAPGLAPGHRFEALGMPLSELDQEYVLVNTVCIIESDGGSSSSEQRFEAISAAVPFRPALRTPRPKIAGFMHAVVDGEVHGTAAPIDALGRYKVIMPYDTTAAPGGGASRWVRMAQPSAGAHYGVHFPLHIGTEVAIIHLDGDPDRPVIVGSVPNVDTISPVVSDNATMSRIRTRGNILFELEDDA